MGGIIFQQDQQLIEWAAQVIGFTPRPDARAIGYASGGHMRAVTVFDTFGESDCNIHIASDGSRRWCSREYLLHSFAFPFIQLKLARVTGFVPSKNSDALRFDLHLGFQREGLMRNAFRGDDLIILGMLREECRWIPEKYRRNYE